MTSHRFECEPCKAGADPARDEDVEDFLELNPGWKVVAFDDQRKLVKQYSFGV